jgi:hypothetical protein
MVERTHSTNSPYDTKHVPLDIQDIATLRSLICPEKFSSLGVSNGFCRQEIISSVFKTDVTTDANGNSLVLVYPGVPTSATYILKDFVGYDPTSGSHSTWTGVGGPLENLTGVLST